LEDSTVNDDAITQPALPLRSEAARALELRMLRARHPSYDVVSETYDDGGHRFVATARARDTHPAVLISSRADEMDQHLDPRDRRKQERGQTSPVPPAGHMST
jgi:hypothetical protein